MSIVQTVKSHFVSKMQGYENIDKEGFPYNGGFSNLFLYKDFLHSVQDTEPS